MTGVHHAAGGRILVTPRSLTSAPPAELGPLRDAGFELVFCTAGQTPSEDELVRLVPGCVGWLAGVEPVAPAVIAAADSLRVIARNGSGADNLPLDDLAERGIRVERALGANAIGVAELTLGLIFAACRHLPATSAGVRAGGWPRLKGLEIATATVGIVGLGAIGRRVAAAVDTLGARILGHDPMRPNLTLPVEWLDLDDLIRAARILTLHCPLPADGTPILTAARIAALPRGAIVINTARAGLVDAAAMRDALDRGQVATYATDVFEPEPPEAGHPLAFHDHVIATSHIGALTDGSVTRATEAAVASLLAILMEPQASDAAG